MRCFSTHTGILTEGFIIHVSFFNTQRYPRRGIYSNFFLGKNIYSVYINLFADNFRRNFYISLLNSTTVRVFLSPCIIQLHYFLFKFRIVSCSSKQMKNLLTYGILINQEPPFNLTGLPLQYKDSPLGRKQKLYYSTWRL